MWNKIISFVLISFLSSGCALLWKSNVENHKLVGPGHISKFKNLEDEKQFSEIELRWKNRHDLKLLQDLIKKLEGLNERNPDVYKVLLMLCQAHTIMAEHVLLGTDEVKNSYQKAAQYADNALLSNTAYYQRIVVNKTPIEQSLDVLTIAEVDALYCSAINQARWARAVNVATFQKIKKKTLAMITRVHEINPDYKYGAFERYNAWVYAVSPFFAGGSFEKSFKEYRAAQKISDKFIANDVEMAEFYAVKRKNKQVFIKQLELALKKDPYAIPEELSEQILMQKKARRLLDFKDNYFNK